MKTVTNTPASNQLKAIEQALLKLRDPAIKTYLHGLKVYEAQQAMYLSDCNDYKAAVEAYKQKLYACENTIDRFNHGRITRSQDEDAASLKIIETYNSMIKALDDLSLAWNKHIASGKKLSALHNKLILLNERVQMLCNRAIPSIMHSLINDHGIRLSSTVLTDNGSRGDEHPSKTKAKEKVSRRGNPGSPSPGTKADQKATRHG